MRRIKKINEHLYYLPYRKKGDRPNLYYIKGSNYAIAVDAGNSYDHISNFYKQLEINNLPLPKYTIISHWHWDHTFALPYCKSKTICTKLTNDKLKEVKTWKWNKASMKQREKDGLDISFCNKNIKIEYPDLSDIKVVTCDIEIVDKMVLDLGDIKVELIPHMATHSDDSLFVYIPSEALFVQDADWINPYISNEYDQEKLKDMINFFDSLDYKYHYLGHVDYQTKEAALNELRKNLL